jgi:hypothetical protein
VKTAEYPDRKCRLPVAGDYIDYNCEIKEHHPGPCASRSVRRSVIARDAWEKANPGWEQLSVFDDPFGEIRP